MALGSGMTEFGRPMNVKPPAPPPKIGWGTSGGTEFGRGIGSGFNGTLKAATPPKPVSPAPKPSPTPGAGANPPAGGSDPYDSQYYIDLAGATAKANNAVAGYNQDISNAGTTLQQNYTSLAHQLALQNTNAQNAENTRGGFGQGALGTTLGNLSYANQAQATALHGKYQNDVTTWTNAINAAQNGLSIETIALQLASADRKAKLVGASSGTLGTPPPAGGGGGGGGSTSVGTGAGGGSARQPRGTAALNNLRAAPAPKMVPVAGRFVPVVARNKIGYHGGF